MKKIISTLALAAALLVPLACSEREQVTTGEQTNAPAVQQNKEPEELGRIGARIAKEPKKADEIIADAGMTREQFEATIRQISANPEQSREYARGYEEETSRQGV
ncbi:MAG: hypothetical protein ACYC7A_01805 [Thermoanaerobaculia bacterium]